MLAWTKRDCGSEELWAGGGERRPMPIVSVFRGIVIRMYHDEHPPPHFHAACEGFEAFVAIASGEVVYGTLPRRAARIVRTWALDRRAQLMANWECGAKLLPMEMIPGADDDD